MDVFSVLIFFIYISIILMILLYVSPILSAFVLILIPLVLSLLLPDLAMRFFSLQQFTFKGVSIQNIHVLLSIWSALIAIVAYTEIISWYLLHEEKTVPQKETPKQKEPDKPATALAPLKSEEPQKPIKNKAKDLLLKLGKIMSGKK